MDSKNARSHNERNLNAVQDSLKEFGQLIPIVVQKQGMIIRAGNGRVMAAKRLGWTHIAAVVADQKDVEAVKFALADNRTAELASWDYEVLADIMAGVEVPDFIGFDPTEMSNLLDANFEKGTPQDPNDALGAAKDKVGTKGRSIEFGLEEWEVLVQVRSELYPDQTMGEMVLHVCQSALKESAGD
jgi:site-specific DNA-methyltransferase (adenine-specific)